MEIIYGDEQDKNLARTGDEAYQIQHGESVYEPNRAQVREFYRNPDPFDGSAVKLLCNRQFVPPHIPAYDGGYSVVVLRRDPEEIRQSFEGAFARQRGKAPPWMPDGYEEHMERVVAAFEVRRDVRSLVELEYEDVLADPTMAYAASGWPVDVAAAANVIDARRRRFARAELEVGV